MIDKNPKYKNEEWLRRKYIDEKLSISQIAKLCGVASSTMRYWLQKSGIPRRSDAEAVHVREVNHCNLSPEAIEWINGELLGDGCLISCSSYSASFGYGSKYLEYIQYVSEILELFGIKQVGRIRQQYYKEHNCCAYNYVSRAYPELRSIRLKWYPEGKKLVPRNIELTPLACRQWYIGDGSLNHSRDSKPRIKLSTDGFSVSDVKWLVKELVKLNFRSTRRPSDNSIGISTYSTRDFLEYIGDCPVECYQYKWNYQKGGSI